MAESTSDLVDGLPLWMNGNRSSGNFHFLEPIGQEFDELIGDVETAEDATQVQNASSIPQLYELAKLVDEPIREDGETVERYKARTQARFQEVTNEATPPEIVNNAADFLGIDKQNITYSRPSSENGVVTLSFEDESFSGSLTKSDASVALNRQTAAGFRIDIVDIGTLQYITPTDYNNGNYDTSKGYSTTDANGDPILDQGGSYSGAI